ncbi:MULTISPECIES: biotin/lipoyl-containing protein [Sphingomonas]|jgi:pyruvate/2-oxoglutarate dehydrogenase complex dihydrolipoamide acyltransferase (E2) component|uniref:Biotin attachment protein n=1 Tax=Sphingomonas zeae TaxID=1646122 RepID=A0A7Y6B5L0_9SPHN|nr:MULTISPECIES: biotin/lipoyl-containing protein [Sphingomonas]MBB4049729.1 pyruvate/2-oxoglutarate dehydrogenase complex dihydrolipoamide acyltransferase (E2) component [Sphingomonas zeae]MDK8185804.1 biotin/lipoyl-containing protein [Sphingomonas zeae]MDK8215058.1 biotin/lipoyl-containing protein [Sphingomonas sp. UMB7805-LC452B]NUU47831.1 biotin attachment protein [Sphingomonas zeae]
MARIEVKMPQWGMGMNEGTVTKWLKSVGDDIQVGEEIVEVEAAKANGAVEASDAGRLVEIVAQEGEEIPVGDVLCIIES